MAFIMAFLLVVIVVPFIVNLFIGVWPITIAIVLIVYGLLGACIQGWKISQWDPKK
ncbi:hypothetical protein [Weissella confusa]|uniref:hypothetical protein n=1 Tax=Weissella confusa TaxID=1583 RepID=UPI0018F1980A|nr:hypothetical protein [Weissella confusa]MBJ7686977.1 hypothetical protein [Weissella confusa]MBJ7697464.1 hypothetical protein [Weissella confusa]